MKAKIRVNRDNFDRWLFVFWLLFFMPPCVERISNMAKNMWLLAQLGIFFLIFLYHYKKRITLSRFFTVLSILLVWCFLCVMLSGASLKNYIKNVLFPVAELIFVLNVIVQEKKQLAFKMLYYVSALYIILNFASMILCPDGLFVSGIGSSVVRVQWFLGSKNNIPNFIIIFMNVIMAYDDQEEEYGRKRALEKWILVAMSVFSIFFSGEDGLEFMEGSSTGIIAVLICVMGYVAIWMFSKLARMITMKKVLLVMGMGNLFLLTGATNHFVSNIVTNIFHKSMTFSGRTGIWEAAVKQFMQSPLLGNDPTTLEAPVLVRGQLTFTNYTYNVVLQYLLSYGMIALVLLAIAIVCLKNSKEKGAIVLALGFMGTLVLGMMNEISLDNLMFFPILFDCFMRKKEQ